MTAKNKRRNTFRGSVFALVVASSGLAFALSGAYPTEASANDNLEVDCPATDESMQENLRQQSTRAGAIYNAYMDEIQDREWMSEMRDCLLGNADPGIAGGFSGLASGLLDSIKDAACRTARSEVLGTLNEMHAQAGMPSTSVEIDQVGWQEDLWGGLDVGTRTYGGSEADTSDWEVNEDGIPVRPRGGWEIW